MALSIAESGMIFGPYEDQDVFVIEKSAMLKRCIGIRTVEFVYRKRDHVLWFVEAKSSVPIKKPDNLENYESFLSEISEKMVDSFNLYMAGVLERKEGHIEISKCLKSLDYSKVIFRFFLIVNFKETSEVGRIKDVSWAEGLKLDLERKMADFCTVWKAEIFVMDSEDARRAKIVK